MTVWRPSPLVRAQWTRKNVIFPEKNRLFCPWNCYGARDVCEFYRFQIFLAHSRWNLFLQVSEQERFLESQVVHFGIGTPSRILKLIQNGERALFVISRLQIASLHAFSHDARLLSKPRSSPSILVLRHDHGTSVSSFRWESTRPWATRTPEYLSLHDLSQISPRAEKRASCSANNKSLLGSYC